SLIGAYGPGPKTGRYSSGIIRRGENLSVRDRNSDAPHRENDGACHSAALIPAQASKSSPDERSEIRGRPRRPIPDCVSTRSGRQGGDDYECPLLSDSESGPISCHSRGRLHLVLARRQIVERPLTIPV